MFPIGFLPLRTAPPSGPKYRDSAVAAPILVVYDSRMNRPIEWLRIDMIRLKSSGVGCLILTFLGMAAILTTCELADNAMSNRKTMPEIATIIGFGAYQGSWHAGDIIVSARDPRGIVGTAMARPFQLRGCHVGDKIRAGRYGFALYPDPAPCPIKLEPHEAETNSGT